MKQLRNTLLIVLLSATSFGYAQEVNTLFFLENAPMRHIVNPAFQPVSNGYVNFTPLGYMSIWAGNNSLTMRDVIYNYNGKTITALHPEGGDRDALYDAFRKATLINTQMTLNILGFGFRHKENGYVNFTLEKKDIYSGDYDDVVQKAVEDLIVDEEALELAFEGTRFFDLMRVAHHRSDPNYLAERVARRDASLKGKLQVEANWYYPLPQK